MAASEDNEHNVVPAIPRAMSRKTVTSGSMPQLVENVTPAPPSSNQRFGDQQTQHARDDEVKAVHAELSGRSSAWFALHGLECEPDFGEAFTERAQGIVGSLSGPGDFLERILAQPAVNDTSSNHRNLTSFLALPSRFGLFMYAR